MDLRGYVEGMIGFEGGGGSSDYDELTNKPSINNVTLSGNKTSAELGLFSGNYNDLTNKPDLFSGDYNDLTNKPDLFSGDYNDLTNKPTLFSGSYRDLTNKPVLYGLNAPSSDLGVNGDIYFQYEGTPDYTYTLIPDVSEAANTYYRLFPYDWTGTDAVKVFYTPSGQAQQNKVIAYADLPTYTGSADTPTRTNLYNLNFNIMAGISKTASDIVLYTAGQISIDAVYKGVADYVPSAISKIWVKVAGVWITTA